MRGVVFLCGSPVPTLPKAADFVTVSVPSQPAKNDIDPWLKDARRLVVVGTDADLAAVVIRLLRKELLSEIAVGFVPRGDSTAGKRWRLPSHPPAAFTLAQTANPSAVPLIRDDAGGVLIGQGIFGQIQGEAYCDEHLVLRGHARSVVVEPTSDGVGARITTGSVLRKRVAASGRAFQVGCHPAELSVNGRVHNRPIRRWTWYRHTEDLQLVQEE